ncbi:MAG: CMD domain protein [Variovorax sp.]|nr:MAG: CMD domain protein [Variovorax sp.]
MTATPDVIDRLMGLQPEAPLSALRHQRAAVRQHSQGSFDALLEPADASALSRAEREAVALRVATLHACEPLIALHRERLAALAATPAAIDAAAAGPDAPGQDARRIALLRHADMLSLAPIDARPDHLQALADAGLTPAAIVTLSQLIGLVAYQVRVVAGLGLLQGSAS